MYKYGKLKSSTGGKMGIEVKSIAAKGVSVSPKTKAFISEKLGQKIQLKVAASTIRTVEKKGGLDDFLVSTPNSKLPEKAKKLKKTILSKIN